MICVDRETFSDVADELAQLMRGASPVRTERWQGVVANTDTFELRNVNVNVDLMGIESLSHWRADIVPNLPWADDHFLERVGGEPLNPGEQWKNWPWGNSAKNFLSVEEEFGPRMSPQDWAYLAGMIDGEGTIYSRKTSGFQGCVRVYQKDRRVLDYLHQTFRVGQVDELNRVSTILPSGEIVQNDMHQWSVTGVLEIRWLLDGCLPYLHVKTEKAQWTLEAIEVSLKREKKTLGEPLKKVWGQDWPKRFNHNYMQRLWPKRLEGGSCFMGHGHSYGDLEDLVMLLAAEPHTRQAWIPLFFPEDTGFSDGGRKMCSLGYQVLVRDNRAHMFYPLRSCDFVRHWADDCYLAVRMLLWIIEKCRTVNPDAWNKILPGEYCMHMTSLHVFKQDMEKMK